MAVHRHGLPIDRLVLATNENDVLDEFFRTGVYRARSATDTFETSSPSMDISKASNFDRFVFDLVGRDAATVRRLSADELPGKGQFSLELDPRFGFVSGKSTHADRISTIRDTHQRFEVVIDPHTAGGPKVARAYLQPGVPTVLLETALPIKFAATIAEAIGCEPARPAHAHAPGIESLPRRVEVLPADVDAVKAYITAQLS